MVVEKQNSKGFNRRVRTADDKVHQMAPNYQPLYFLYSKEPVGKVPKCFGCWG